MKSFSILFVVVVAVSFSGAQDRSYQQLFRELKELGSLTGDSAHVASSISSWLNTLTQKNQIPFIENDSVLFIYQGKAKTVSWMGDFNAWGYDKKFPSRGTSVGNELWYMKASFPGNARLDYKIVVNGTEYLLDPANPHQQWSGVGGGSPNSELRMPAWKMDSMTIANPAVPSGKIIRDILMRSNALGYQITYSVYLPANVESLGKLDCIYVTDGYEYLHPQLGNMAVILDNMIAAKKIRPIVAIFIDHREPINRSNNKRMQELAMNKAYLDFFVKELIPAVEKNYPVKSEATSRAILGTSMGGLTATYFAFTRPDVFGMAGIQSPAFYTRPEIYQLCSNPANPKMKISMTTGLINDASKETQRMKDILATNSCEYHYREVNEGHSWGNWRNLIDDILVDFFGTK